MLKDYIFNFRMFKIYRNIFNYELKCELTGQGRINVIGLRGLTRIFLFATKQNHNIIITAVNRALFPSFGGAGGG